MASGKMGDTLDSACEWISYLIAAKKQYLDEILYSSTIDNADTL